MKARRTSITSELFKKIQNSSDEIARSFTIYNLTITTLHFLKFVEFLKSLTQQPEVEFHVTTGSSYFSVSCQWKFPSVIDEVMKKQSDEKLVEFWKYLRQDKPSFLNDYEFLSTITIQINAHGKLFLTFEVKKLNESKSGSVLICFHKVNFTLQTHPNVFPLFAKNQELTWQENVKEVLQIFSKALYSLEVKNLSSTCAVEKAINEVEFFENFCRYYTKFFEFVYKNSYEKTVKPDQEKILKETNDSLDDDLEVKL